MLQQQQKHQVEKESCSSLSKEQHGEQQIGSCSLISDPGNKKILSINYLIMVWTKENN